VSRRVTPHGAALVTDERCTTWTTLRKRVEGDQVNISRDGNLGGASLTVNRMVHRCTGAPMHHVHHPKETSGVVYAVVAPPLS
jgi:hypothetical protein